MEEEGGELGKRREGKEEEKEKEKEKKREAKGNKGEKILFPGCLEFVKLIFFHPSHFSEIRSFYKKINRIFDLYRIRCIKKFTKKTRIKNLLINYEMFSKFINYPEIFHIKLEFINLSLLKIYGYYNFG